MAMQDLHGPKKIIRASGVGQSKGQGFLCGSVYEPGFFPRMSCGQWSRDSTDSDYGFLCGLRRAGLPLSEGKPI